MGQRKKERTTNGRRNEFHKTWHKILQTLGMAHCLICGYDGFWLDYHHMDEDNKTFEPARLFNQKPTLDKVERLKEECICLCANCHRAFHHGTTLIRKNTDD